MQVSLDRVFAMYLTGDFPSIITVKPQKLHTHTHTHTLINEKAKGRLNPKDDENLLKIMQSEIMGIQQSQWQMKISVMNFMYGNKVVAETYML